MDDIKKTKKQLIEELNELRQCVAKLKDIEKEVEQTRVNQEKFTKAFLHSSIPIGITTLKEGRFIDVSDAYLRFMGLKRDKVIGHTSSEIGFITEKQREIFIDELNKHGRVENHEMEITASGGQSRYGLFNAVMMSLKHEKYLLTIMIDITDRKQAEEKLVQSEANFRGTFDQSPVGSVMVGLDQRFIRCNWAFCNFLGYSENELIGKTIADITYPEDLELGIKALSQLVEKEMESFTVQKRYLRKDGSIVWGETSISLVRDANNKPLYFLPIIQDIAKRKLAEEALVNSEGKLRLITENIVDCVSLVDASGVYQYVTPSYTKTLGYNPADMIGMNGFSITHPDDLEWVLTLFMKCIDQGVNETSYETRLLHRDGHYVEMELRARALNDKQGKIMGAVLTARDITQRKQMETELLRARNLESLGVLAGGIAHDFNNLMAIILGYIDLALMGLPPDHASHQYLLSTLQTAEQTNDLASRLITFSRGGGPNREIFDVAEIIRDAVHRTVKGTNVQVKFDFGKALRLVALDELQMKQVFYNLTKNATDAMPDGGNLTIQTKNALIYTGQVPGLKEGAYLKITFTDEGIGIPEEHLSKLFDPYFTTKKLSAQKGLGLGLSVCYSVLKKHNGHITVKKAHPGKGSSFVLYLPVQADLANKKEMMPALSTGTIRVLIMDDEHHIRNIERAYLEQLGYEVTDVTDGQEAIQTYQKALHSGQPFDLVMLDLTVRQGLGGQLAMEHLLKIDPAIRAIVASGYVADPVIENYTDYGFQGALKKPFKGEEMKVLVEKVLQR